MDVITVVYSPADRPLDDMVYDLTAIQAIYPSAPCRDALFTKAKSFNFYDPGWDQCITDQHWLIPLVTNDENLSLEIVDTLLIWDNSGGYKARIAPPFWDDIPKSRRTIDQVAHSVISNFAKHPDCMGNMFQQDWHDWLQEDSARYKPLLFEYFGRYLDGLENRAVK